jgi:hypothetical protein
MHSAKEAAKNFLHRDKQNDTEVREVFKPAVTKETYVPVEKVEEVVAIDREVHKDHYQTRIQPVEDKVRAPEKHEYKVAPVIHREQKHGNHEDIHKRLQSEAQELKSTTTVLPTTKERVEAGVLHAEHVHHHVYETIQPVIEREIVQPTVVHTTVPVHEVIQHAPTIHPRTVQPVMTMEEFRRAGGALEGKPEVRDIFSGEPQVCENGGAHQTHPNPRKTHADGHHPTRNGLKRADSSDDSHVRRSIGAH